MDKCCLSRRAFLRLAAVTTSGVLFTACLPAPEAAPPADSAAVGDQQAAPAQEAVTVEWWPGWPDPAMEQIAKLFQEQHPGITIKANTNYPDMAAVLAAISGGTPPDIVADVPYLELIARDVILPLDDMLAASNVVSLGDGDIRKEHWEVFAWEGKHYGVPAVDTAGRQGMGYNLELVKAAGLDPTQLPQTWDEAFDWHKKITTYDSASNLDILGMDPMAERTDATSYGDPWMWPQMWGFHYYNPDEKRFEIDREETVDFLGVIKRFYDDVGVEKMQGMSKANEGIERGAFGVGKAAMRITYPSGPAAVWQTNPKQAYKFTWVPLPSNRQGKKMQTLSGHAYIILKDAKQPKAAFQLAEFMTTKAVCDILFEQIGWLGPRKSWQSTVDLNKFPPEVQENMKFFTNSLDEADELWFDKDPIESITQSEWGNAWQGVVFGKLTPQEAAANMQAKLSEELKNALGYSEN